MSGVDEVLNGLGPYNESVQFRTEIPSSSSDVEIFTPLENFISSRRWIKAFHNFVGLYVQCRKDLYARATALVINDRIRALIYMNVADQVAHAFHISIAKLDRQIDKTSIFNRVHTRKLFLNTIKYVSTIKVEPASMVSPPTARQNSRVGKSSKKRKDATFPMLSAKLNKKFMAQKITSILSKYARPKQQMLVFVCGRRGSTWTMRPCPCMLPSKTIASTFTSPPPPPISRPRNKTTMLACLLKRPAVFCFLRISRRTSPNLEKSSAKYYFRFFRRGDAVGRRPN